MAKHFSPDIGETTSRFIIDTESVSRKAGLDGLYVTRSSLKKTDGRCVVLDYKSPSQLERAFRSIKMAGLEVHPIHHYDGKRAVTHLLSACRPVTPNGMRWRYGVP